MCYYTSIQVLFDHGLNKCNHFFAGKENVNCLKNNVVFAWPSSASGGSHQHLLHFLSVVAVGISSVVAAKQGVSCYQKLL